jgi:CubicO group peptidase (beta-lactamase class C family)
VVIPLDGTARQGGRTVAPYHPLVRSGQAGSGALDPGHGTSGAAGRWGALVDRAQREVDRGRTPAAQLAVAVGGELQLFEALGTATPTTRFPAYSATKPLVASAVWQLLDEGLLAMDDRIGDHVPELAREGIGTVTVEQLLLHTAGFPNAPMGPEEGADPERRRARFTTWRLDWEPGSRFAYHAGSAHWVLVDLLERAVPGAGYCDEVHRRVTAPLGLPRLLGLVPDDQADIAEPVLRTEVDPDDAALRLSTPSARAAGVPGGGGIMTAADLALYYQALLRDPAGLWAPETLADATGRVRCTLPDPLFGVPVNRSLGLVLAGDDGLATFRYACFGEGCSPAAFGHAGAHGQVGWADPVTGASFAYLHNSVDDAAVDGARAVRLSGLAAGAAAALAAAADGRPGAGGGR